MNLTFVTAPTAILLAVCAARAADAPAFEVASVKPAPPPVFDGNVKTIVRPGMTVNQARVEIRYMSMADLIRTAYRVKLYQVTGPGWITTERYQIQATIPAGVSQDQVPEMLQTLLAVRFKLDLHRDPKDLPVFALIPGKNGIKLAETTPDPEPPAAGEPSFGVKREDQVTFGRGGGTAQAIKLNSDGTFHIDRKMTMAALADFLAGFVDRPVIDMTGTKALYQVALDVPIGARMSAGRGNIRIAGADPQAVNDALDRMADASMSIFTAVQKLGLKLDPRKAPVEVLVVDHAEKIPTEN